MNLLTVQDVADALKISKSKTYDLVSRGKLVYYRVEGSIRVSEVDLAEYLDDCRVSNGRPKKPRRRQFKSRHFS